MTKREEETSIYRTDGRHREKIANLRSKRAGRYVPLKDKSMTSELLSSLPDVDGTNLFSETLDFVRQIEKTRRESSQARAKRQKARQAEERRRMR